MSRLGIIIVDHGSRSDESNKQLEEIVRRFSNRYAEGSLVVEPAHMELAEPNLASAYERCVSRGVHDIIVCPYFLGPGKHWQSDIPKLVAEAAAQHPQTTWHVAAPLGVDDLILNLLAKRIGESLALAVGEGKFA